MTRETISCVVISIGTLACLTCDGTPMHQRKAMSPTSAKTFPPRWSKSDRWSVSMKTQAPVPADLQPQYTEQIFRFVVASVPEDRHPYYRIDVSREDAADGILYGLYFRAIDFSLQRVTRRRGTSPEETLLQNGEQPFIYYARQLPIVPDFPMAGELARVEARREFVVQGGRLTQTVESTPEGLRITLEKGDPSGLLRVNMSWVTDDPWWSVIQCRELPPGGLPGQTVASGYLLKDSIQRAKP